MGYTSVAHRLPSAPSPFIASSGRRPWAIRHRVRLAAFVLLLVWIGPVSFLQTDTWQLLKLLGAPVRASADARVIPAGEAALLEPETRLELHLHGGKVIKGSFVERTLLDSAQYAPRFAKYALTSPNVPLTMGESLSVLLQDGRELVGPFAGYGELTLLLRSPDGTPSQRVPFEFATEIHRANGDQVQPSALARAFKAGKLPSAEALTLREPLPKGSMADGVAGTIQVAVEDIEWATAGVSSGVPTTASRGSADPVVIILVSVVVSVVLVILLIGASIHSAENNCGSIGPAGALLGEAHLTTRAFDRDRGCYVGDELAVDGPWPGTVDGGQAATLGDPGGLLTH